MKQWSRLKKAVVISAITILGLGGVSSLSTPKPQSTQTINPTPASSNTQSTPPQVQSETTQQTEAPVQNTPIVSTPVQTNNNTDTSSNLFCPNGTYVNSDGITVCSPYAAASAPEGATAKCYDGTYSFSLHHSGTCSHHGGVAEWL